MADIFRYHVVPPPVTLHRPPGYAGRFTADLRARAAYSEGAGPYRIVPNAVAVPRDTADVTALVLAAADGGWSLVPRGAGSGIPGGNVGHGIVVDLQELRHAELIDEQTVRVGPAVTWRELDTLGSAHGLRLPPDPSSGAYCTIGGMVATNAAGARTVRYGPVRPWVSAVAMVTGDGELIRCSRDVAPPPDASRTTRRFALEVEPAVRQSAPVVRHRFPKTRKNSAGYALDHYLDSQQLIELVIGSEGTLGIITDIELRLDPRPPTAASLLVALPHLDVLPHAVEAVRAFEPAAIEFLDSSYLQIAEYDAFPTHGWAGALLVDIEGEADLVATSAEGAAAAVRAFDPSARVAITAAERERLWTLRHAASPVLARLPATRRSLQIIEDGCVPVAQLGAYITAVHAIAADLGVPLVAFGHAGDGHLHVNALADTTDPRCVATLADLLWQVTRLVIDLGGTPSGEHGDGRLRTEGVANLYGSEILQLFRSIKAAFDPVGVFNPGVIVAEESGSALADLKVGTDVAAIPNDVASALRGIERSGNWGVSRLELPDAHHPR